jgi:hypothetical protein
LCQHPDETADHMTRCPDPAADTLRQDALDDLRQTLRDCGTDPAIRSLLLQGISGWFATGDPVQPLQPPDTHPFYHHLLDAIAQQNAIGWDQILRGRLSSTWGLCYTSWAAYSPSPDTDRPLDSCAWTSRIIKWSWDLVHALWKHRNKRLFNASSTVPTTATHLRLQAKVRDRYFRSRDLPRQDLDTYFHEDVDLFQLRQPHVLEAWVAQVDRIFIRHRKEIRQRHKRGLITHYFSRPSHPTHTIPPAGPN